MTDQCIFCRIARGEIPAAFVAESDDAVAIRDINPQAPLHVLVISREHIESLDASSDDEMLGRMLGMVRGIARDQGVSDRGYRTVINTNSDGGQSVPHLHIHLLAGRPLDWPPG